MSLMTIQKVLEQGSRILSDYSQADAIIDSRLLLEDILECNRSYLLLNPNQKLTETQYAKYKNYISDRAKGIPLQHILGYQSFMGLDFIVSQHTLIPRRETEELVELALGIINNKSNVFIMDLGTGTGCIPISLAVMHKGVKAVGIDISDEALNIAKENADKHRVNDRIIWEQGNLFFGMDLYKGRIDMIISNPPYIKSSDIDKLMVEVKEHEPHLALDGGYDGLDFYRRICEGAKIFLKEDGFILFEIGFDQADDVTRILIENGFKDVFCKKDLSGMDRMIHAKK